MSAVKTLINHLSLEDSNADSDLSHTLRQKGQRVPGSCEWLPKQDKFRTWADNRDGKLHVLWLLGAPGIGKTMISSYLVDELRKTERGSSPATFAFYLCNYRNENRRTASVIVRSLLVQLLQKQPNLFEAVESVYQNHNGSIVNNLSALLAALGGLLCRSTQRIYILIDALDECEESSRHHFLAFIRNLGSNLKVSIIITSRPVMGVEYAVRGIWDVIRIDSAKVNADLSNFINMRVNDLQATRDWPPKLIDDIRKALLRQAGGTFLWASLVLEDMAKASTAKGAREKLAGLPKDLSDIYKRILGSISNDDVGKAAFILQWVVATRKPIDINDLAIAQFMADKGWNGRSAPSGDTFLEFKDGYRACGPLLFHDKKDGTINLVHQSAKDFLTSSLDCPQKYRVDYDKAQLDIWESCAKFLSLAGLKQRLRGELSTRFGLDTSGYDVPSRPPQPPKQAYYFEEYAVKELDPGHSIARFSPPRIKAFLDRCDYLRGSPELRDFWILSWGGIFMCDEEVRWELNPERWELNPERWEMNPEEEMPNRPLEVCQLLVGHAERIPSSTGAALFFSAIQADNAELVSYLLDQGTRLGITSSSGHDPLSMASLMCGTEMLDTHLWRGAQIGNRSYHNRPLILERLEVVLAEYHREHPEAAAQSSIRF
ncbi:NACHT domain-containing protein [Candidatus Bathyarchaeota archaeon]|nr:NACHT domain-containing protein [Candidatus Bathyarchaeota archaeon]